jgi:hypothetical protein
MAGIKRGQSTHYELEPGESITLDIRAETRIVLTVKTGGGIVLRLEDLPPEISG